MRQCEGRDELLVRQRKVEKSARRRAWRPIWGLRRLVLGSLWMLVLMARAADAAPTSVMVLYFDNNTGKSEYDSLAKGLADMMITDLSTVASLQVVERGKLEALLGELKLQRTKYFDAKTAQRIGAGIGAAYAVTGAFVAIEPNIRLDVRMIRIETGVVVKAATVTGSKDDFFALQQQLTAQLVEGLSNLVSKGDAAKIAGSTRTNKVDNLSTLVDYGKGIDAHDRGDLDGASKQLQKVVASSPDFQLGKDRYRQVMKALFDAKNVREKALSTSSQTLLKHIHAELAQGTALSDRVLAYRILLGQYHEARLWGAIKGGGPATEYKQALRAHVDSQIKLFDETKTIQRYSVGNSVGAYAQEDQKLAREHGIEFAGDAFIFGYEPYAVVQHLGWLLIFNTPSTQFTGIVARIKHDVGCFFELDPAYAKILPRIYEDVLRYLNNSKEPWRQRVVLQLLQDYGRALTFLRRPEEAMAKLQEGLDKYPTSEEFGNIEAEIRKILDGKLTANCR